MSECCHWPSCKIKVSSGFWACKAHWTALPERLRYQIRATYAGDDTEPSHAYAAAVQDVEAWIAKEFGARADRNDPGRWERLVRTVRERDERRRKVREADNP
jgi:hypothetical protein